MKKIVRLTESDLTRIIKRVINEQEKSIGVMNNTLDPLNGAKLTEVYIGNNDKETYAVLGPQPEGVKPKINFPACTRVNIDSSGNVSINTKSSSDVISGTKKNNCFVYPQGMSSGHYDFSMDAFADSDFYFYSKIGDKYKCKFSEPCVKQ